MGTLWVVVEVFGEDVVDVGRVTSEKHEISVGKPRAFDLDCAAVVSEKLRCIFVETVGILGDSWEHSEDGPICGSKGFAAFLANP
nr:hypothetical protein Iba_chr12aCG12010 [Ipomoea batatas]GMD63767.1 hypothetical protein Iba_chr12bCG18020 [Ipomoea batatas]GMD66472.1 hypothetical protein Iba_chr12cCG15320 [Ipomoea batatas]